MKFDSKSRLDKILERYPKAEKFFEELKIDIKKGEQTLEETAKIIKVSTEDLVRKLNDLYEKNKEENQIDFDEDHYSMIIDYIDRKHHSYLYQTLPDISEKLTKMLRVHGPYYGNIEEIHRLFHNFKNDMERYLIKEEVVLFPLIADYEEDDSQEKRKEIAKVIEDLEKAQIIMENTLNDLRKATEDYFIPQEACKTFTKTFKELENIEKDSKQHFNIEQNTLYKRLKK